MFVEPGPLDNPALSGLGHHASGAGSGGEGLGGGTSSDEAPPPMVRAFPNLSHSRSTTTNNNTTSTTTALDGAQRPSFKRLPSQTLESAVSKRAARGGWGEEEDADSEEVEVGPPSHGVGVGGGTKNGMMPPPPPSAYTESAMDRYRRQSAPTGVRPGVEGVEKA